MGDFSRTAINYNKPSFRDILFIPLIGKRKLCLKVDTGAKFYSDICETCKLFEKSLLLQGNTFFEHIDNINLLENCEIISYSKVFGDYDFEDIPVLEEEELPVESVRFTDAGNDLNCYLKSGSTEKRKTIICDYNLDISGNIEDSLTIHLLYGCKLSLFTEKIEFNP